MSKSEAIKVIEDIRTRYSWNSTAYEALWLAVKALREMDAEEFKE